MIKKKNFFDDYDDKTEEISTIFKSSIKLLKFSGNIYYDVPMRKYSMFNKCATLHLNELLPLTVMEKIKPRTYGFNRFDMLKIEYDSLSTITQVDCINIKQNVSKYDMYLIW